MERPFDIITFDCYGTLIDWESGMAEALQPLALNVPGNTGTVSDHLPVRATFKIR